MEILLLLNNRSFSRGRISMYKMFDFGYGQIEESKEIMPEKCSTLHFRNPNMDKNHLRGNLT
ncbi:MAG TPA: hypothetical protein PLY31_06850 [Tenuifilaceae bacterium]|nr:hypothetical protein [Tenuifilaceae bacterium]